MDRDDDAMAPADLTRRQLLRRSAAVGGALVWTTPVVQSLSGPALAATPSPAEVAGVKRPRGENERDVAAEDGGLAGTGANTGDLAALGVGAVAAGAALRAVAKRRRAERDGAGET